MRRRPLIGFYALDMGPGLGKSWGIYNFTKHLIEALHKQNRYRVCALISRSTKNAFIPNGVEVDMLPGRWHDGIGRIMADQCVAVLWAYFKGLDAVVFPKGLAPILGIPRCVRWVTINHDAIHRWYLDRGLISGIKERFIDQCFTRAILKSDLIMTVSEMAKIDIIGHYTNGKKRDICVIGNASALETSNMEKQIDNNRRGILIIGSRLPHKASAEAIKLCSKFLRESVIEYNGEEVFVVGIEKWPTDWGDMPIKTRLLGTVSRSELIKLYSSSRVLVFTSLMEGFGMPAVEAWQLQCPVIYRTGTAVEEVLFGIPGGWNGCHDEFTGILKKVLSLTSEQRMSISEEFRKKYKWELVANKFTVALDRILTK